MSDFVADIRDLKFVLFDQLDLRPILSSERYGEYTAEDCEMVLDEAYKFAREVLGPANAPCDREGCTFDAGKVTVPAAFHEPYRLFCENGWLGLAASVEQGGQGAPLTLASAVCDPMFGSNISFNLAALLTTGAAHLIETFGSDELKAMYCERMYSGEWAGTMCLTEPQAGSDLAAATCKAVRDGDHFRIEGEKIFITFGEHDLTDNIVHAVLARIEGAPKGTKGLSLFVVPKVRVNPDGSLGEANDVVCSGIEHKLGIHGSPTCSLVFGGDGGCEGWLLGEENQGIRCMFQMMNEARLHVGLQGVGTGNAAYQAALAFAKERLQGPDIKDFKDPEAPRVPIIRHPDVRVMLLRQKAYAEGCRALVLFTSWCADRSECEADEKQRAKYHGLLELLTPIVKAYCSDMGFRVTEWALQTFGGYGYISEYPAEQYLRDCKIASIYEGTNGIQAMDLVARKLGSGGGAHLMGLMNRVNRFLEAHAGHAALDGALKSLVVARDAWAAVNGYFMGAVAQKKLLVPLVQATQYLSLCGDVLLGWLLTEQATIAWDRLVPLCEAAGVDPADGRALGALARDNADVAYYDGKVKTARFFAANELPLVSAKAQAIQSGDMSPMFVTFEGE